MLLRLLWVLGLVLRLAPEAHRSRRPSHNSRGSSHSLIGAAQIVKLQGSNNDVQMHQHGWLVAHNTFPVVVHLHSVTAHNAQALQQAP